MRQLIFEREECDLCLLTALLKGVLALFLMTLDVEGTPSAIQLFSNRVKFHITCSIELGAFCQGFCAKRRPHANV